MHPVVVDILLLVTSIYAIVRSSDLLVDQASRIGNKLRLGDYFIGSFLVGIGTSLPELFTSVAAVNSGTPTLVAPTIFGTIIANLGAGFGLGVLGLYFFVRTENGFHVFTKKHALSHGYLTFDTKNNFPVFFAGASVILAVVVCWDNVFSRTDALLFFGCYAAFMFTELNSSRRQRISSAESAMQQHSEQSFSSRSSREDAWLKIGLSFLVFALVFLPPIWSKLQEMSRDAGDIARFCFIGGLGLLFTLRVLSYISWGRVRSASSNSSAARITSVPSWVSGILLVLSIAVLYFSGVIVVHALQALDQDWGIDSGILAASALAIGTSLPDVVVALNVVRRGRHKLLVGHIFQSNVFDVFLIMAICGFVTPLTEVASGPAIISILASVVLTLPLLWTLRSKRLTLSGGIGLFLGFVIFLGLLFG